MEEREESKGGMMEKRVERTEMEEREERKESKGMIARAGE